MITNANDAIRAIFQFYFQRSFDPDLHENCQGCQRPLSTEEMEKDLKYQEKLVEMFSLKMKKLFCEADLVYIANKLSDPPIALFMKEAFIFCDEDAVALRSLIFDDEPDDGHDERRLV